LGRVILIELKHNIQAALSGMPASIQHVGRAVDAFQGQARFNERNEEAAVANTEFERRPRAPRTTSAWIGSSGNGVRGGIQVS
jgi:hypothetical protein